jgi:hypothetical protein
MVGVRLKWVIFAMLEVATIGLPVYSLDSQIVKNGKVARYIYLTV